VKPPKRLFRHRDREPDPEARIHVTAPWPADKRPVLLTEPHVRDLAPYGEDMLRALEEGYERGLVDPHVLVIWRGGRYAREQGLDRAEAPLIFRPVDGPEFCRLTGCHIDLTRGAANALPRYTFTLAGRDGFVGVHIGLDMTPDGVVLAWRYSRKFRREDASKFEMGEEAIRTLERLTDIGRDD
jgi:hypothetical protein